MKTKTTKPKKKSISQRIKEKGEGYFADMTADEAAEILGCKVGTWHGYASRLKIPYQSQAKSLSLEDRIDMVLLCHEHGPVHAAREFGVSRQCADFWYGRMAEAQCGPY